MKQSFPFVALVALAGCAQLGLAPQPKPAPVATQPGQAPPPPRAARTVEQFDTTTAAQRAAASAEPTGAGRSLGTVVASLGDPSQPGFWVETDLVSTTSAGRVTSAATGRSVEVELRPISDGSARVSLAAWRLLEVPLTDLAEVAIFANPGA